MSSIERKRPPQCDKCGSWAFLRGVSMAGHERDEGTCVNCYIAEMERGELQPSHHQSGVHLAAKDLPTTLLSDHLEHRLFNKLRQERQDRARQQGKKTYHQVPGAEPLVVRVVSSVDKKLQVERQFLESFHKENYPSEFPYKSKVVLLFQKIEGVEVCLFGMYIQEYGSECPFPNKRWVYLSSLDFLEYFQPEVKAVNGDALSTVVYHEILIGYLDYCKKRGFTCCYIWACPPLTGEDYILKRHDPEIQKRPNFDKFREWYLAMLRKASEEQIVVETTNLFDQFFISTGECKAKVTAVRLPYFDGDYWPGAAEDLINQLHEDARKQEMNQFANASEDHFLMHKLGETISPMKEDFIMVHLQHYCNHCAIPMVSGNRWVCNRCKNFQICDECYEVELKREEIDRHPVNHIDMHILSPISIVDVPVDTKDRDEILESEFFDERHTLLSLCQGKHYQCDTLSHAKCFSMMMLHHLHSPTLPVFAICSICHLEFKNDEDAHYCETCIDYVVCRSCYHEDMAVDPPHKLANNLWESCFHAQNAEARQQRVIKRRRMNELLVHASQCHPRQCGFPYCVPLKAVFRHGAQCDKRASGGCICCIQIWYLLRLHGQACKESECRVPRCGWLQRNQSLLSEIASGVEFKAPGSCEEEYDDDPVWEIAVSISRNVLDNFLMVEIKQLTTNLKKLPLIACSKRNSYFEKAVAKHSRIYNELLRDNHLLATSWGKCMISPKTFHSFCIKGLNVIYPSHSKT